MPHILSPERWRQIPDYPVSLNARHPSAQGLVRLYNFQDRGRDAVDGGFSWGLGSFGRSTVGHGGTLHRGFRVNATATLTSNESIGAQLGGSLSVLLVAAKHAQIVNSDWIFGAHASSVGLYDWGFIESASGGPMAFYAVNTGGTIAATPNSTLWSNNAGVQAWVGTFGSGDQNVRQYCNGVQTGSAALAGTLRNSSLQVRTCFWNNGVPDFSIFLAGVWNRALGVGEVQEISRNYAALLMRERRVFYSLGGGAADLVIAAAMHAHLADALVLSQVHALIVPDAMHGHTAETFALTQEHVLAVVACLHQHDADNLDLSASVALAIADALHAQGADNAALGQVHSLALADALHAQGAEGVTLDSGATVLAITDALHTHAAEALALSQVHVMVVSDALHAQLCESLSFAVPGVVLAAGRSLLLAAKTRALLVLPESRALQVSASARALEVPAETVPRVIH